MLTAMFVRFYNGTDTMRIIFTIFILALAGCASTLQQSAIQRPVALQPTVSQPCSIPGSEKMTSIVRIVTSNGGNASGVEMDKNG